MSITEAVTRPPQPSSPEPPLYAQRVGLIDTENAFKVGPYIAEVEAAGPAGDPVQPGRARLPPARGTSGRRSSGSWTTT